MNLKALERIRLLEALPERGNLATMRMVRKLRESLEFKESENGTTALCAFVIKGGKLEDEGAPLKSGSLNFIVVELNRPDGLLVSRYLWDKDEDTGKEIRFSNAGRQMILDTMTKLDKDGAITADWLSLADKFMEEEEPEKDIPPSLANRLSGVPDNGVEVAAKQ